MQKTPFGLKIIKSLIGAPFNHTTVNFWVDSSDVTPLFINDPIKIVNQSDSNGIQCCTKAASSDYLGGIVVGFEPLRQYENQTYRTANTARTVYVCRDPFVVMTAYVNSAIYYSDVGKFINIDNGTGNTNTGISNVALDYASLSTVGGQFKITQILSISDSYSIVECIIQKHEILPYVISTATNDFYSEVLPVISNGQTSFTLSNIPQEMQDIVLNQGVFAINGGDFSVSGNNLTWLNPISLAIGDTFIARYYI
jgi:hypothetical protein